MPPHPPPRQMGLKSNTAMGLGSKRFWGVERGLSLRHFSGLCNPVDNNGLGTKFDLKDRAQNSAKTHEPWIHCTSSDKPIVQ